MDGVKMSGILLDVLAMANARIVESSSGVFDFYERDDSTIRFTLRQPYAYFLENMTLGILPKDIWGDSPIELNDANTNPVGSGPYMVSKVSKQSSGIIDFYELESFKKFTLGAPHIKNLILRFYLNNSGRNFVRTYYYRFIYNLRGFWIFLRLEGVWPYSCHHGFMIQKFLLIFMSSD